MRTKNFHATAQKCGAGSYGLKIFARDRDAHLVREWGTIFLDLPGSNHPIEVNIDKRSMWEGHCRELISTGIRDWLKREGKLPWPKNHPPKVLIEHIGERLFSVALC